MARRIASRRAWFGLWRWLRRRRRLGTVENVASMSDIPTRLGAQIFIIGQAAPKWAVFECPCRCGERIDVNLMTSREPNWQMSRTRNGVTLAPSLWMPCEKCGSHFFVRNSRVIWV
jgi:hypothetical protein